LSVQVGTRFGSYEIIGAIGAGGMGEVYRARDTRLSRDVAIKILPASLTNDPDRRARFAREAQVLASLNHPNIAAIHHVEETGDGPALVMELVEGETLADRIARGPIPVDEALAIAKQIAEALEAAHEQGIIHRDLKPANIKVRPDGTVKVLDFGLAKLAEASAAATTNAAALSMSPTITSPALMSGVGVLLGTAAYMSPEQARGRAVDKRSDIWAFGCVLYEMLTGKRAFEGTDVPETLAAVLRSEPAWVALPAMLLPSVRAFLYRCLEKEPKQRVADIRDVRLEWSVQQRYSLCARTRTPRHNVSRVWEWSHQSMPLWPMTPVPVPSRSHRMDPVLRTPARARGHMPRASMSDCSCERSISSSPRRSRVLAVSASPSFPQTVHGSVSSGR
jgi:eukaryotic-like serine/threonine-protein kinase